MASPLRTAQPLTFDGFERGRADVGGGARIAYRRAGAGPPVVLLHGWPQHSLMWHAVAPRLAERFTAVVPDLRGAGASTITAQGYDKATLARDVHNLITALELGPIGLAGYDLGAGVACAYARQFRADVRRLAVMEFALAGFGYEAQMAPQPDWTLASNWHLGLFCIPQAAEWLCRGRERELLAWFFWHLLYAGSRVSAAHLEEYVQQVSKLGALRAGLDYCASVWQDARDNAELTEQPLSMPSLALGGEASSGPLLEQIWRNVLGDVQTQVIPHAGHWLGDENPGAVADALLAFFGATAPDVGHTAT